MSNVTFIGPHPIRVESPIGAIVVRGQWLTLRALVAAKRTLRELRVVGDDAAVAKRTAEVAHLETVCRSEIDRSGEAAPTLQAMFESVVATDWPSYRLALTTESPQCP